MLDSAASRSVPMREDLLNLSKGASDPICASMILALLEEWGSAGAWVYKKHQAFQDATFGAFSMTKIRTTLQWLESKNLVVSRYTADKWDRTKEYQIIETSVFNTSIIQNGGMQTNSALSEMGASIIQNGGIETQNTKNADFELEPADSNQTLLDSFSLRESDSFNAFNNNIYTKQEKESNTQSVKESKLPSQLESESPQASVSGQESSETAQQLESKPKKSRAKSKAPKADSPAGETPKPKLEVTPVPAKPKLEDYQDYVKIVSKAFNLAPGSMVGKWVNFFTGRITDKKGDFLYYQPEKPLDTVEIAGLYFWYWVHPRYGGRRGLPIDDRYLPRTVATIAQRIDEFRADPKYTEYLEKGKAGLQRLLDGNLTETPSIAPTNLLKDYYKTPQRDDPALKSNAVDEDLFRQAMNKNAILKPNLAPIGEKAAMTS